MTQLTTTDPLLKKNEAAARAHRSPRTLERYRKEGGGPIYTRLGPRDVRYYASDIDAWLNRQRFESIADEHSRENRADAV